MADSRADSGAGKLLPLMLVLSATTGLVDAVSVLGLGKVFTANMTGNVVFLGMAVAGAPDFAPVLYVLALVTFLLGAMAGGQGGKRMQALPLKRWLLISALIESALLVTAALVATGYDYHEQAPRSGLYSIIALTALAMGYRNATIRQLKIPDITTTVLTLTLTGLAADSSFGGGANVNWGRRILSVTILFAGATAGAILVLHLGLAPPLLLAAALILLATLFCSARLPS